MKLGIAIFPADFAIRPDELARAVEERGFESLFLTDHTHIPATPQTRKLMEETQGGVLPHFTHNYDPFVALTYAAAATHTLRLGTGVCLVPQREPIATAKALASLDVLSHGRVLFGVGVGWIPEEIANHGIDPPTRWAVMDERVHAMRAIWTQDEAEYHGRHLNFGPIWSWPKPKQRPHPPILVGGAGKGSSAASSHTATNGCRTPACPWSGLVRGSASFSTRQAWQVAAPTSPSPSKAPNPTLMRSTSCARRASPARPCTRQRPTRNRSCASSTKSRHSSTQRTQPSHEPVSPPGGERRSRRMSPRANRPHAAARDWWTPIRSARIGAGRRAASASSAARRPSQRRARPRSATGAFADVGRALNPALVGGQMRGGTAQGLGWALLEELVHDGHGQLTTGTFVDYAMPTASVVPPIETEIVEVPVPEGPYGAKGVGEAPVVGVAGAVANAIAAATGARVWQLPMTPERVWCAMSDDNGVR